MIFLLILLLATPAYALRPEATASASINDIIRAVREDRPGLCFSHSVILVGLLERLGYRAVMMGLFNSDGVKQEIYASQNGYCGVPGCLERIDDIHHRLHNTKFFQKLFPLFLQSPFNGVGLSGRCHSGPEKEQFNITEKQARMYEEYLQKIKDGIIK